MSIKIYGNDKKFILGLTLKDDQAVDCNNMAFHHSQSNQNVIQNRRKVAQLLNVNLSNFVFANQTHSQNIYKVTHADRGSGVFSKTTAIANTDALYTDKAGIVLGTFAADCVPVMFYNETCGIIGVIHSGWRGTVNEITCHMFNHLARVEDCQIDHFRVYIGAAISQIKFEVDEDVYEEYHQLRYADDFIDYKNETNKYYIDNQQVVKKQCERIGIPSHRIIIDHLCTFSSKVGFSYRENKTPYRHMGFIMKK